MNANPNHLEKKIPHLFYTLTYQTYIDIGKENDFILEFLPYISP